MIIILANSVITLTAKWLVQLEWEHILEDCPLLDIGVKHWDFQICGWISFIKVLLLSSWQFQVNNHQIIKIVDNSDLCPLLLKYLVLWQPYNSIKIHSWYLITERFLTKVCESLYQLQFLTPKVWLPWTHPAQNLGRLFSLTFQYTSVTQWIMAHSNMVIISCADLSLCEISVKYDLQRALFCWLSICLKSGRKVQFTAMRNEKQKNKTDMFYWYETIAGKI